MQHQDIRRALCETIKGALEPNALPKPLRPYQQDAIKGIGAWLEDLSGSPRGYVSHATGLGKTYLFSAMASQCVGLRVLIIVPSKVLLEQTARVLCAFTGSTIGHLSSLGNIHDSDGEIVAVRGHKLHDVVITTDESFIRRAGSLSHQYDPHLIIWDECHWGYTVKAQRALRAFPRAVVIGMTATPDYLTNASRVGYVPVMMDNGQSMYAPRSRLARTHFHTQLDHRSILWGIQSSYLSELAWGQLKIASDLRDVPVVMTQAGLDFHAGKLQKALLRDWPGIVKLVCNLYQDPTYGLSGLQAFAVCPGVTHARTLAQALKKSGIKAEEINGKTPTEERNAILKAYDRREIQFLSSVMVLREGWDANAQVAFMLRPARSFVFYVQAIGRILRPDPDIPGKVGLVIDLATPNARVSPLSAPMLFAPPGSEVVDRGMLVHREVGRRERGGRSNIAHSPFIPEGTTPQLVMVNALEIEQWAGKDGTFESDGDTWGTPKSFAKFLPVSAPTISERAETNNLESRKARTHYGQTATFYKLSDVRRVCADLIESEGLDSGGWFEDDGHVWATRTALIELLSASGNTVETLIELGNGNLRSRQAKPPRGIPTTYYCLYDMRTHLRAYRSA